MVRDRARNALAQARTVNLGSTPQIFNDAVGLADKNDLYRVSIGDRSSFNLQLTGVQRGANIDVELFSLKGAKAGVLRRIGRIDFNNLRPSDIRRYLSRVGRSARRGRANESLTLPLNSGEYYVRVLSRNGDSSYRLTLTATPENPGNTPTPTPGVTPTPTPGVTPTPTPGVTPTPTPGVTPTPTPGVTPTPTPTPGGTPVPSSITPTWIRQLGTTANDYAYGVAVTGASVAIAGTTEGTLPNGGQNNAGGGDNFLARFNSDGSLPPQLVKQFGNNTDERIFDIEVDTTGNYYVAGISAIVSGLNSNASGFVAKYNSAGVQQWQRVIDTTISLLGISLQTADGLSSLALDNQGNVFIAGFVNGVPTGLFPGVSSPAKAFVEKLNGSTGVSIGGFGTAGRVEFAGTTAGSEGASGVAVDGDGNVYITGVTNATLTADPNNLFTGGDAFVVKYNGTTGQQVWAPQILATNTQDYARGIAIAGSNVYITGDTSGSLPGQTNAGGVDGFLAQFTQSNNGTTVSQGWVRQFGTSALDESQGIATDSAGNIYITGETNAALFGGNHSGNSDIFVAKFDSTGTRLASTLLGTAQGDEAYNIRLDGSGNVYVVGQTQGNLAGAGTHQGNYDAVVIKYGF
jgi:Beta-propeller repeat